MKVAHIIAFFAALIFLFGFLLFGGLLILPQHGKGKTELVDVSIEEQKKPDQPEEDKPKELEVQEREKPQQPPEMKDEAAPPLNLASLELALNPELGAGGGDFLNRMPATLSTYTQMAEGSGAAKEEVFAIGNLDQPPRVVFQPAPQYPPELKKKKMQGTVYILFIVDLDGRVRDPKVQKSDHAAFDMPAMNAVRKWRFEPGKVGGKAVQFRMRVPITFAL
jgi:protein TonB